MKVGAPALHRLPAWPLQQPTIPPFLFCSSLSVKSRTRASAPASASELRNADGSDTVIGFQCNERYLEWDGAAGRQLIRIHCARQLGTDVEHVNAKLEELAALLPDLVSKLENLKADLVLTLVRDTEAVARRMLTLREALPGMNVSGMVAGNLWLLQKPSKESLQRNLQAMRYISLP